MVTLKVISTGGGSRQSSLFVMLSGKAKCVARDGDEKTSLLWCWMNQVQKFEDGKLLPKSDAYRGLQNDCLKKHRKEIKRVCFCSDSLVSKLYKLLDLVSCSTKKIVNYKIRLEHQKPVIFDHFRMRPQVQVISVWMWRFYVRVTWRSPVQIQTDPRRHASLDSRDLESRDLV